MVFVTPDAVLAIIEVKSKATSTVLKNAATKLSAIGRKLAQDRDHCSLGLFAYECDLKNHDLILETIQSQCPQLSQTINFVSLGCSTFIRFWDYPPFGGDKPYDTWHAYNLKNMSPGYFITNILDAVSPESIEQFSSLWFPSAKRRIGLNKTAMRAHLAKRKTANVI